MGNDYTYSKAQATRIYPGFLDKYPVKSLKIQNKEHLPMVPGFQSGNLVREGKCSGFFTCWRKISDNYVIQLFQIQEEHWKICYESWRIIDNAIKKTWRRGSHILAIFPPCRGQGNFTHQGARQISSIPVQKNISKTDPFLKVNIFQEDGDESNGWYCVEVKGSILSILSSKGLFSIYAKVKWYCNSNIRVHFANERIEYEILDTRKPTPNLRELEKYAVASEANKPQDGSLRHDPDKRQPHRFAGGVEQAIHYVNKYMHDNNRHFKVEIEVRNFEELLAVIMTGKWTGSCWITFLSKIECGSEVDQGKVWDWSIGRDKIAKISENTRKPALIMYQ